MEKREFFKAKISAVDHVLETGGQASSSVGPLSPVQLAPCPKLPVPDSSAPVVQQTNEPASECFPKRQSVQCGVLEAHCQGQTQ